MNELFLYQLFQNILAKSNVIAGRFVVAEGYGNDLNANAYDNAIIDALGQLATPQKYPVAILLPPVEIVSDRGTGWCRFKLRMFFLSTTYNDGASAIAGIAANTNTSSESINHVWNKMRNCAGDFRTVFNTLVRMRGLINSIREADEAADVYERYSMMNNDRVSGVCLSFELDLFRGCAVPADYPADATAQIALPNTI
jgi:hypothetical protein